MQCQTCGHPQMEKMQYEGVEIEVCPRCGAKWLDNGELQRIVKLREERFDQAIIDEVSELAKKSRSMPPAEISRERFCPKCNASMTPVNYQYSSNIIIDRCPNNHGVWLDPEELEKIQAYGEHWMDEVQQNKGKYTDMARQIKVEYDMKYQKEDNVKVSHFDFVNKLINGIIKLDF